jgi:hypothetical protein
MKSRLLHNLILALVVAGVALFLIFKPEKAGPQKYRLSKLQASTVTRLSLAPTNREPIVLEKSGDTWRMTSPFAARADDQRVAATLDLLQAQSESRLPANDLAKFELDKPFVRLRANDQEFVFGGRQPVTNELYVATGGYVYLVPATFLIDLGRGADEFASKSLLGADETIAGFVLPGLTLSLKDGKWQRTPDTGALSADDINRFADEWRLAIATSVNKASATKPAEGLQLILASGKTLDLAIIAREPELVLRREDEGLEYHFPRDVGERLLKPAAHAAQP